MLGKFSRRKSLWNEYKYLPDSNYYSNMSQFKSEKNEQLKLGAIEFDKRADRQWHVVPKEAQTLEYDTNKVTKAVDNSSN